MGFLQCMCRLARHRLIWDFVFCFSYLSGLDAKISFYLSFLGYGFVRLETSLEKYLSPDKYNDTTLILQVSGKSFHSYSPSFIMVVVLGDDPVRGDNSDSSLR
jgi:hypothetical protein